jgi:hypothetical protein
MQHLRDSFLRLSGCVPPARISPLAHGTPLINEHHFLVVGLVRNCAAQVDTEVARLAAALAGAKSVSWLLIESDSSDATPGVLEALRRSVPAFDYRALGNLRERLPLRTQRIAHCRNAYLQELRSNPAYRTVDCVIVADFDGVNDALTKQALESCWQRDDWDACTANQAGPYYDLWALRHPTWSPNDCFDQYRFHLAQGQSAFKAYFASVYARMIRIHRDSAWIAVDSAFGGLVVYRKAAMLDGSYSGLTADGNELCEHVSFHRELRAQGRLIFINPQLVNTRRSAHTVKAFIMMFGLLLLGDRGVERIRQALKRA